MRRLWHNPEREIQGAYKIMSTQTTRVPDNAPTGVEPGASTTRTNGTVDKNTLRNIQIITEREYKNRVRQRSFLITTILMAALIAIGAFIPTVISYFSQQASSATTLTIANNAGNIAGLDDATLAQYFTTSLNGTNRSTSTATNASSNDHFKLTLTSTANVNQLQSQVKNGKVAILLVIDRTASQDLHFTYYTNNSADTTNQPQIQTLANQLSVMDHATRLGLKPAQTQSLFTPAQFTIIHAQQQQNSQSANAKLTGYLVAMAGMILIFTSVTVYGIGVATGVAEEKGSRIMEILINAATPFQLMVGKILGIGAAGLTQMMVLVVVGLGALALQDPFQATLGLTATGFNLNLSGTPIIILILVLIYFILGFLMYATLFAAIGALVQRQDEVQNGAAPINMIFMIGYLASFIGGATELSGGTGEPVWFKVMSFIPFWTPTVMLMRVGVGNVSWWEIVLSIGILIATIIVCAWFAARIYRFGVLMYGQKPKLGQLIKIASSR
jgi:ABC-2 type transport system permease protein